MSHFDEWMDSYFSREDADKIYSIGCESYTSSSRKKPNDIRAKLKELNVHEDVVEEFLAGVFHGLHEQERKEREKLKGIIVYQIDVLSLPPHKAEAFMERFKNNVKKQAAEKFDQWGIIVIPVRMQGNRVFLYSIDGASLDEIKPLVMDHGKFMNVHEQETKESVNEFIRMMVGAPVKRFSAEALEVIEHYVDRAFEYDVNRKQEFVLEEIQQWLDEEKGVITAPAWSDE